MFIKENILTILNYRRRKTLLSNILELSRISEMIGSDWWRSLWVHCSNHYSSSGIAAVTNPVTTGNNTQTFLHFTQLLIFFGVFISKFDAANKNFTREWRKCQSSGRCYNPIKIIITFFTLPLAHFTSTFKFNILSETFS